MYEKTIKNAKSMLYFLAKTYKKNKTHVLVK